MFYLKEHPEIADLKREIRTWKSTVNAMPMSYTHDEDTIQETIQRKIAHLEHKLNRKLHMETLSKDLYQITLADLQEMVKINSL